LFGKRRGYRSTEENAWDSQKKRGAWQATVKKLAQPGDSRTSSGGGTKLRKRVYRRTAQKSKERALLYQEKGASSLTMPPAAWGGGKQLKGKYRLRE